VARNHGDMFWEKHAGQTAPSETPTAVKSVQISGYVSLSFPIENAGIGAFSRDDSLDHFVESGANPGARNVTRAH
jgi:hypothetical protein